MHLSVKVPIEYPIKAIHIKVNSTIQAAKVELKLKHIFALNIYALGVV